jgi:hypothetical protein
MAKGMKTGGRKKGTPNRVTLDRERHVEATGLTPLQYFLGLLRDPAQPDDVRFQAAKEAAPYVHPKLASIEGNMTHTITKHDDVLAEIEAVINSEIGAHGLPN